MWSHKKSKKSGNAWSMVGASCTISLVIPVRWVINHGIGVCGFMSVWNVFTIFSPSNCAAAISVIWCLSLLRPVVSISTITYCFVSKIIALIIKNYQRSFLASGPAGIEPATRSFGGSRSTTELRSYVFFIKNPLAESFAPHCCEVPLSYGSISLVDW